jgi:hypothetical protein
MCAGSPFGGYPMKCKFGRRLRAGIGAWLCSATVLAGAQPARNDPRLVQPIRGQHCLAFGPAGYAVVGENAQRIAFGADIHRADGRAGVSFSVLAGGPIVGLPSLATPEAALASMISSSGQTAFRWGRNQPLDAGLVAREYETPIGRGVMFFRVIPQQGGFVIVARMAQATPDAWQRDSTELISIALSMRCRVPMVPAAAEPPPRQRPARERGGERSSEYNWVLGMETYHDPRTGQNYWVSPSTDRSPTGPEGEGYYVRRGNDTIRLAPGYSQ